MVRSSCEDLLAIPGRWDIDYFVYLALGPWFLVLPRCVGGVEGMFVCVIAGSAVNDQWTGRVCWIVRVVFGWTGFRRMHAC